MVVPREAVGEEGGAEGVEGGAVEEEGGVPV